MFELEQLFKRADTVQRHFTAPLARSRLAYLGHRAEQGAKPSMLRGIRNHADALRAFFRFAEDRGWCQPGLAAAITSPRVYKDATLPAGPSADDLKRLLATTEGDQPQDIRDRALLLTRSVYGLRAGEARGLRLDDINWDAETLRVHRPKTGRTDLFPLSRRVGDAIARYLREARPRTAVREVFLIHQGAFRFDQRLQNLEHRAQPHAALRHRLPASRGARATARLRPAMAE